MTTKYILAATIAFATSAFVMAAAHAMTGRAAIDKCINRGTEGGCIFSCNQDTGACIIDMLDTGQIIICPTPSGECHMGHRKPKAGMSGVGSKSTAGATAQ